MNHQNSGLLSTAGRARQVAFDAAIAIRRLDGYIFGLNAAVVFGNLLGPGVVGTQALKDRGDGEAAGGEFLGAIHEVAASNVAVNVEVEKIEQLLREVGRFLAFHGM